MDSNHQPKFGIICATYNRASLVSRAIESVLSQSVNDWELIIIDDGSIDNTPAVVSDYLEDKRVKLYRRDKNKGVGDARNFGVTHSTAPWILLLDSDNALLPDALEKMMRAIERMPDISMHKFCVADFNGVLMGKQPSYSVEIDASHYLCGKFKGEHHTVIRRDLLIKHPFFEDFNGGEGITWSLIALDCKSLAYHPFTTEHYETEGSDRLSVRARNYQRLQKVYRKDISSLWLQYLKSCPVQLIVRVIKFLSYLLLYRVGQLRNVK